MQLTCYEANGNTAPGGYSAVPAGGVGPGFPAQPAVNPAVYVNIPGNQGGHKWKSIQTPSATINTDGSLTINIGDMHSTYAQLLNMLNGWIDSGYFALWEGGIFNWRTVSEAALRAFMQRLNADLHGPVLWVNLNEVNGSWGHDQGWYDWNTFGAASEVAQFNATSVICRQIRDNYALSKIRLAYAPTTGGSISVNGLKPSMDAGDYYDVSCYWSYAAAGGPSTDPTYLLDADNMVNYLVNGDRYSGISSWPTNWFGGYNGKSGPAYNSKPWILHEFGHQPWLEVNTSTWIQRILGNIQSQAPFVKLMVFWGPMDFSYFAQIAPTIEGQGPYDTQPSLTVASNPPGMLFDVRKL